MKKNSLTVRALSITLGLFYIFIGLVKITPNLNEELYNDWRNEFSRYNRVFPLYSFTKWRPVAHNWRLTIGLFEIICGAILALIPGRLKNLANVLLITLMIGALYTHLCLGDKLERISPSLIFGSLLLCRLITVYQVDKSESNEELNSLKKETEEEEEDIDNEEIKSKSQSNLSQIYRDIEEKKIK